AWLLLSLPLSFLLFSLPGTLSDTGVSARTSAVFPFWPALRSLPPALLSHRLPVLSHTEGFLSPFQGNRLPEGGRFSYGGHGLSGAWHNGGRFLSSALPGGLLPRQCFPALLHGFFHGRKQRRNLPPLKLPSLKSPYRPHAPCRFLHPQRINASPSSVLSGSAPVWFSL